MAIEGPEAGKSAKCAVAYSEASRNQVEVEVEVGARRRATASAAAASRTVAAASGASASAVASAAYEELDGVAPGALATVVAPWWAMRDRISSLSWAVI
jgi:hypothetical protein